MSTPESEFELELKRLVPAAPSDRLKSGIERDLQPGRGSLSPLLRWSGRVLPLAAAAGIVAALIIRAPTGDVTEYGGPPEAVQPAPVVTSPEVEHDVFVPIRAINQLYDARYLGMVTTPDGGRARQVVYRFLDTVTWQNQTTRATFELTVPRDEVYSLQAATF